MIIIPPRQLTRSEKGAGLLAEAVQDELVRHTFYQAFDTVKRFNQGPHLDLSNWRVAIVNDKTMPEYTLLYIVRAVNIDVPDGSADTVWLRTSDEYSGLSVHFAGMLLRNDDVDSGYICFKEVPAAFLKPPALTVEALTELAADNPRTPCTLRDVIDETLSVYPYYINAFSDETLAATHSPLTIQDVIDTYSRNRHDDNNGADIRFLYYNDTLTLMFIREEGYDSTTVLNADSAKALDDYLKSQMSSAIKYAAEPGESLHRLLGNHAVLLDEVVYQRHEQREKKEKSCL